MLGVYSQVYTRMATSRVENSAQVLSCQPKAKYFFTMFNINQLKAVGLVIKIFYHDREQRRLLFIKISK
jgi:hypothetical protein